jgi:NAD(P)-dependent dehydrogenase (short-subunit alcohol dehydrogenase family)
MASAEANQLELELDGWHRPMGDRLAGRSVLVTGGGSGIGAACARRLAAEGARVVVSDINAAGELVATGIRDGGGEAAFVQADVSTPEQCHALVDAAVAAFGGLDVLVAAAGISHGGYLTDPGSRQPRTPLVDVTPEDWQRVLAVNLDGIMFTNQAVARHMLATGVRGAIVNITSMNSQRTSIGTGTYSVSKAAAWMLTKSYAVELASAGIRVNAVAPGFIQTPMTERLFLGDPSYLDRMVDSTPLGRLGQPDDIAGAVLYLASDDAAFVTGTMLFADGGYLAAER